MVCNKTNQGGKPFLRWAGSKRQLLPLLSRYWNNPSYTRYVEPFAGSACLFFRLSPRKALLGDINQELITTYQQLKHNAHTVLSYLRKLKKSKEEYYRLRTIESSTKNLSLRAARFIYLNRYCFNGLYRTNRLGNFNVPYGGDDRDSMPPEDIFLECSKQLQVAELVAGDFEKVMKKTKKGDFVYMDPPFSVKAGEVFNAYDASRFSTEDIKRLRKYMIELDGRGITFLVSYADSEEADFLKKGFYFEYATVKRSIAGFAAKRKRVNELLISNRKISKV